MADTRISNDFEASDRADQTAESSLLPSNSSKQTKEADQETAELAATISSLLVMNSSTQTTEADQETDDFFAAMSLLALHSSPQTMSVHQDTRSHIPQTSLPIKQPLKSPGQCCGINAVSSKESISRVVNSDHTQRYVPLPASRRLEPECCCFIRELSVLDADHDVGRLYLTRDEAEAIPSCPRMTEVPKNTHKMANLLVFDYQDVPWKMMLKCYKYEGNILYHLSNDSWRDFLRANDLRPGDTIFFYKNRDSRINADGYYYVILFWKAKDGGFKSFLDLPCKKKSRKRK
ncbi:hypothetical protein F511_09971 [Dorcoceras hygrometricum]|uniref:TF-B3 domain-containing protein n=1 Tax=Dorcoceras hygrometricum TaxID=472368 RepID=A0A2Z7DA62_9LAMI|nr:hypothetical protein F511_09971 [Dorcoceras hygrometricum]